MRAWGKAKRRRGEDLRKVNGGGHHVFFVGRTAGSAQTQIVSLVTRLGSQLERYLVLAVSGNSGDWP